MVYQVDKDELGMSEEQKVSLLITTFSLVDTSLFGGKSSAQWKKQSERPGHGGIGEGRPL